MKDTQEGKLVERQEADGSSRRKFLVKTSAGIVITTLPAHSVWGACNASGLSGGSRSAETVCIIPEVSGGRSPGSWAKYVEAGEPANVHRNKVREMFSLDTVDTQGGLVRPAADQLNSAFCSVRSHIASMDDVVLSDGSGTIPYATLNIQTALKNSGGIWNLAGYYLNAYFGFYGDISPFNSAEEMVQHVWAVLIINYGSPEAINFDVLGTSFTDGSTDSSNLPSGSC